MPRIDAAVVPPEHEAAEPVRGGERNDAGVLEAATIFVVPEGDGGFGGGGFGGRGGGFGGGGR